MSNVFEPDSLAAAADVLASSSSLTIEREGGTDLLSTRKLDRLLEHEPGDLTAIVEAGMRLSTLQAYLAPFGQMLALDPPGDPTLGACLAGDLSGPRSHRYGTMRDLVIGVTVVLADGTIASSGGKVVKNVAGYDLGKLFSGSRGRLGLIGRLALRLHARPAVAATAVLESADPRRSWSELQHSGLSPVAVNLLPPERLALLFEGSEAGVAAQIEACPGQSSGHEVWQEVAVRQQDARGRVDFGWQDCLLARPGRGVAYVADAPEPRWSALAERVRASFDPKGTLA